MSEKAYRTMRIENRKREENLATRTYLSHVGHLENRLDCAEKEIERLRAELDRAQAAYRLRATEARAYKDECSALNKQLERQKASTKDWYRAFVSQRDAHIKLSEVVRIALTPEEYRHYREMTEAD